MSMEVRKRTLQYSTGTGPLKTIKIVPQIPSNPYKPYNFWQEGQEIIKTRVTLQKLLFKMIKIGQTILSDCITIGT